MIGIAPMMPIARNAGSMRAGAPMMRKQTASVIAVSASVTASLAVRICPAPTFASISVRSVCFSFSSARP